MATILQGILDFYTMIIDVALRVSPEPDDYSLIPICNFVSIIFTAIFGTYIIYLLFEKVKPLRSILITTNWIFCLLSLLLLGGASFLPKITPSFTHERDHYKDQVFYKAHSKDKSITIPRKVNIKNVDATELSLQSALNNDKEDTFEWTGKANPQVNSITITEDKSRGGLIGPAIDDLSTIATGDEHKHIRKYKYENNKLELISEYDK